jgi:hypothetical protein
MPAVNATASHGASRALVASLEDLKAWRESTSRALASFRRWALVGRMLDEPIAARLAHLEQRLAGETLTVAFLAEYSRGKSELVNALLFASHGARPLPSGVGKTTLCPTEISWNPQLPPGVRLLPIDTRLKPQALREYLAGEEAWKVREFDPADAEAMAQACAAIGETIEVPATVAADLGLGESTAARVEIPRWRYAIVNVPHPLLELGLTFLDTPGHNASGAEPELALHRIPDAAAVVFVLSVDTGVTRSDLDIWNEQVAPVEGLEQAAHIVLNKIDGLRDEIKTDRDVLSAIDRQIRSTADALGVAPTRIVPMSARQALVGRVQGDADAVARSRIWRLEQELARTLARQRRDDHMRAARAEVRPLLGQMRALIKSRREFALEQLEELTALQEKNQKLVETLARRSAAERHKLQHARMALSTLKRTHGRLLERMVVPLDPADVRESAGAAREAVLRSRFSSGIAHAIDGFFAECRDRVAAAVSVMGEAQASMSEAARRFPADYGVAAPELVPFGPERFAAEIDRLEALCARELKRAAALVLRPHTALAQLFFDSIATQAIHVFEIADREARAWMGGFIRPLEQQVAARQERTNSRIEGMGRMQDAEGDLVQRLEDVKSLVRELGTLRDELEVHAVRLEERLEPRLQAQTA